MRLRQRAHSGGFTLIEMLVVVAIIGILMAILVPVVYVAVRKGKETRLALEISQLDSAITAYRDKYKDYPPDFFDTKLLPFPQTVAYRHIVKVFPNIDPVELDRMASLAPQIDNAEALVFWLGGLSDDARFPFSGKGGPIIIKQSNPLVVAVNTDRNKGLFEFDQARLGNWIEVGLGTALSTDEVKLHGTNPPNDPNALPPRDVFPVYAPAGRTEPYVYFDSRTYSIRNGNAAFVSRYAMCAFPQNGVAVPHRSNQRNPNPDPNDPNTAYDLNTPFTKFYYVNRDSFQILSAGLDGSYGIQPPMVVVDPMNPCAWLFNLESLYSGDPKVLNQIMYKIFPNANLNEFTPAENANLVVYGVTAREDRDNIANYSEGIFENKLP